MRKTALSFPIEVMPPKVRGLLEALPEVVGSRPEYGALGILWATGLCSPRTKVEIKDNYQVAINFFGAIVVPKGDKKSPALGFTVGPILKKIETEISRFSKEHGEWLKKCDELKMSRTKSGNEALRAHREEEPSPPWWGAITMGTSEGIRDIARQNNEHGHPAFVGQFSEELDSWVKAMGKYAKNGGDGGEMAFYLQAHDGDLTIKANKGEKTSAPKFRLSLLGTIQPKVFREAFHEKIENGLMDRFIIVTGTGEESDEFDPYLEFPEGVLESYDEFINDLWDDSHAEVLRIPDACRDKGREMYRWLKETDSRFKCEAASKWWGQFHKMAGLLAVLWGRVTIDAEIMDKAIELTKYLVNSWCVSFRAMSITDVDETEKRITEILRTGPASRSAISRQLHSGQRKSVDLCLESMGEDGIIKSEQRKGGNGRLFTAYRLVRA